MGSNSVFFNDCIFSYNLVINFWNGEKMNLEKVINELGPEFEKRASVYDRENSFAKENFLELKERGAYKSIVPTSLGGGGLPYDELCYLIKELAKFCPSTALTFSMHQHLVSVLVYKHLNGDEAAKKTLQMLCEKDLILLSTGGGDWVSSNGSAKKVDGGYKVSCVKSFCSGAPIANVAVMSCAFQDTDGEKVLHFSAPMNSEGINILDDWNAMGMKGTGSNTVEFNDVFIPDEKIALIRERGKWHPVWNVVSSFAFPVFFAPYAGIVEAITEKTVKLLEKRPVKSTYSLASLGEMHNNYKITKWAFEDLVMNAKNLDLKPDENSACRAHQAKSIISKHGRDCAQAAMEALGGFAYTQKCEIERLYRDLMAAEFHPMQAGKQKEMLGSHLMGGELS